MPISAGLREDIAVYRGFIGQQYYKILVPRAFDTNTSVNCSKKENPDGNYVLSHHPNTMLL